MGNQQGRLWWLAGLIDGEGNFGASYCIPSLKEPRKHVVRVYFQLEMTDQPTLKAVAEVLEAHGIVYTESFSNRKNKENKKWKPMFTVKVTSFESLVKMIDLLGTKMVCKYPVASLLRLYCLQRLERKGKSRNSPYTLKDIELVEKIRAINYRPNNPHRTLNDFTPRLPIQDIKIKSEQ